MMLPSSMDDGAVIGDRAGQRHRRRDAPGHVANHGQIVQTMRQCVMVRQTIRFTSTPTWIWSKGRAPKVAGDHFMFWNDVDQASAGASGIVSGQELAARRRQMDPRV